MSGATSEETGGGIFRPGSPMERLTKATGMTAVDFNKRLMEGDVAATIVLAAESLHEAIRDLKETIRKKRD